MVYIITDGELVKIGVAKNVENRLKGLQTANGRKLRVVYVFDGNMGLEKALHRTFKEYKTIAANEWFKVDLNVLESGLKKYKKGKLDVAKAKHKARFINVKTPNKKIDYTGVKKLDRRKDIRSRRKDLLDDIRSQIETSVKMISYAPLVNKYGFTKPEITFFVRSSRLSKSVFTHNSNIAKKIN